MSTLSSLSSDVYLPAYSADLDRPRTWIQPVYRSFNGLRALAVLAVFFMHYGIFWNLERPRYFLWAGVDLFFVLSGFLITGILYDSLKDPRYFRNFYTRRALRIFPLFYLLFLLLLVLTPVLHLTYPPLLWSYAVYVGNLVSPFTSSKGVEISMVSTLLHGAKVSLVPIGHFWSLCVEEQFYLLWPAVVWFVRDRKRLMQVCCVLCILVFTLRVCLHGHYSYLIYGTTYCRFDTMLVGAWMALWLRGRTLTLRQLRRISSLLLTIPSTIFVFMVLRLRFLSVPIVLQNRFVVTIGFTLVALSAAGAVLRSLDDESLFSKFLRCTPLHALGTISYGFYLIHMLPITLLLAFSIRHPRWTAAVPVFAFVFTASLATLSFRYFEQPFLKLKHTFTHQQSKARPLIVRSPVSRRAPGLAYSRRFGLHRAA